MKFSNKEMLPFLKLQAMNNACLAFYYILSNLTCINMSILSDNNSDLFCFVFDFTIASLMKRCAIPSLIITKSTEIGDFLI